MLSLLALVQIRDYGIRETDRLVDRELCRQKGSNTNFDKGVFVKHEQAPTAPKLEGVWVFVDLKYIFYENRYFRPI